MKLLTLNTHSLVEENYSRKLHDFVQAVLAEKPDVIALQEVDQSISAPVVLERELTGFVPCAANTVIKADNHAYNAVKLLREGGLNYCWTWLALKKGYERFDEGIAVLSRFPIAQTDVQLVSGIDDYNNWKTRKLLGIRNEQGEWFYSVHMGWWNDPDEPFQSQWQRLTYNMRGKGRVWLMGDFNNPAEVRGEGYDMVKESGWHDTYTLAADKDIGHTVEKLIDGWKEKLPHGIGMRIDQIWCSEKAEISRSRVMFNGDLEPIVSDHYGVSITVGKEQK